MSYALNLVKSCPFEILGAFGGLVEKDCILKF